MTDKEQAAKHVAEAFDCDLPRIISAAAALAAIREERARCVGIVAGFAPDIAHLIRQEPT